MKVKSSSGATGWRLILEMAVGGALPCIVLMLLHFHTSLGDGMPDWLKLLSPIGLWIIGVVFFILHRTPDKKGVEYKVW